MCSNVNSTEGRKGRPFWQIDCTIKEQGKALHILVLFLHKWMLRLLVRGGGDRDGCVEEEGTERTAQTEQGQMEGWNGN